MSKFNPIFIFSAALIVVAGCTNNAVTENKVSDTTIAIPKDTIRATTSPVKVNDSLLIPGVAAGQIVINEDASQVFKLLGKPDAGDAAMQKAVSIWYKDHDPKSASTAIYSARDTGEHPIARIMQIRITSPDFKTKEGIGVTSTTGVIKKTFNVKKIRSFRAGPNEIQVLDSTSGIAFEIDQTGKCVAIIIHPGKEKLQGTYLQFQ